MIDKNRIKVSQRAGYSGIGSREWEMVIGYWVMDHGPWKEDPRRAKPSRDSLLKLD
jgi:hypothetical protein